MGFEYPVTYFEAPGRENTEATLQAALKYAKTQGVKNILVATTKGDTGLRAAELFQGFNLVVVTHMTGFRGPGSQEVTEEIRRRIQEKGGRVLTTTHALSGVERGIRIKTGTWMILEIMAHTLRLFGEGSKVAIEITVMAADSGCIPMDQDVIAIGGTGSGADTALHIKPAHSNNFFDLRVKRIICKPGSF
jgi:hypothetical protein